MLLQLMRSLSRLALVQWGYLCEVVAHPDAVMVASVLSAWPEGSLCLQSAETYFEPVTPPCQEALCFDFRKVPPVLHSSPRALMSEDHRWSSGDVSWCVLLATTQHEPCFWTRSWWQMARIMYENDGVCLYTLTPGEKWMLVSAQRSLFKTYFQSAPCRDECYQLKRHIPLRWELLGIQKESECLLLMDERRDLAPHKPFFINITGIYVEKDIHSISHRFTQG